jgi:hypothetical protein
MSSIAEEPEIFRYELYEFLTTRDRPIIHEWVKQARLTTRDRAALNLRFKRIRQVDFDLARGTLFNGPIHKHVYKCVIHGEVMLRPMLCRGPFDLEVDYTLLLGAIERNWKLPKGAVEQAEQNRDTIIGMPTRRTRHETIPKRSR